MVIIHAWQMLQGTKGSLTFAPETRELSRSPVEVRGNVGLVGVLPGVPINLHIQF
jgi:hypothetical protein